MTGSSPEEAIGLLARALRNDHVESWHLGSVAAATPEGRLVARVGDPEIVGSFLRSAAKPFQALPLLETDAVARFALTVDDLALICASHSGRPEHAERAASLLARGGFTVDDLRCGIHVPIDAAWAAELARRGEPLTPLHNNCSGKHAGMLLACRAAGWPTDSYLEAGHPLQQRILERLAAFARVAPAEVGVAVDNCGVPTYRLTVAAAARAYAALADPSAAALADPRAAGLATYATAAARVVTAMTGAPEMVAGPGRFTTRLMQVTGGRVLAKEGYEGFYGLAVRGPVALGVALKIADGGERCRDGIVLEVLRQLGSLSAAELAELQPFYRQERLSHHGDVVGEMVPDLVLETVEE